MITRAEVGTIVHSYFQNYLYDALFLENALRVLVENDLCAEINRIQKTHKLHITRAVEVGIIMHEIKKYGIFNPWDEVLPAEFPPIETVIQACNWISYIKHIHPDDEIDDDAGNLKYLIEKLKIPQADLDKARDLFEATDGDYLEIVWRTLNNPDLVSKDELG